MRSLRSLTRFGTTCGIVAAVLCSLGPAIATAGAVRGHGKVQLGPASIYSPSEISVDAWLDDDGVAYGTIAWIGDSPFAIPGGPADPFIIDVQEIVFDGNTAYVTGVVVASAEGLFNGFLETLIFTDNSGTAEPDEIDGEPIVAGNITVTD